jgi:hypothetical protein
MSRFQNNNLEITSSKRNNAIKNREMSREQGSRITFFPSKFLQYCKTKEEDFLTTTGTKDTKEIEMRKKEKCKAGNGV